MDQSKSPKKYDCVVSRRCWAADYIPKPVQVVFHRCCIQSDLKQSELDSDMFVTIGIKVSCDLLIIKFFVQHF